MADQRAVCCNVPGLTADGRGLKMIVTILLRHIYAAREVLNR